ncbi:MAG: 8-amino-7-oxononanoate synthase [Alphaproteobacteria bacterium]|nr:MAG: 8-amino-7-oxononanoate synthase [Alphaproteobacteria bacterium]
MNSLNAFAADKLAALEARQLRRWLEPTAVQEGAWVLRGGRRLLSFSSNDYLGLSQHPAVKAAACQAIACYGAGAGASRLVTGDHPLMGRLEARLAALKDSAAACVFGSGYLANLGLIPTLASKDDIVFIDALGHACMWAGARLAGAAVVAFRHNDTDHLAALLAARRARHRHALIASEGVFSMDGDRAPLPKLADLARAYDAWLLIDDAHGLGVLGAGRGSVAAAGLGAADVPLQMGTLSKALGSYGGYVCASAPVIGLMKTRARSFVYSTGLPPASAAAALAAIDVMAAEPERCARPLALARDFARRLCMPPPESPIVPLVIGAADATLAAMRLLADHGFLAVAIRPPTVPPGTARLRLCFSALHTAADVERLADLIVREITFARPAA